MLIGGSIFNGRRRRRRTRGEGGQGQRSIDGVHIRQHRYMIRACQGRSGIESANAVENLYIADRPRTFRILLALRGAIHLRSMRQNLKTSVTRSVRIFLTVAPPPVKTILRTDPFPSTFILDETVPRAYPARYLRARARRTGEPRFERDACCETQM